MKVQIENRQTKFKIDRKTIRNTVQKIFRILESLDKEISICFTDDENIKELNRQYLNRNKPTNVLSFSLQEGEYGNINPQMLGDVIISVETAQRDAASGNLTIEQELDFLLIHGILHLTGYNHENTTEKEIKKMELKEKEIFNKIHYGGKTLI
jgi:probable rRNA maturation factor